MVIENVVVDTNVLLSAAFNESGAAGQAFSRAVDGYCILQSQQTFDEFVEVIYRNKFDKYISDEIRGKVAGDLEKDSDFIEITHKTTACRDPKDNKFLELAVSGEAKYILSGDKDLLDMGQYQGIEILSPRSFLEREQDRAVGRRAAESSSPKS